MQKALFNLVGRIRDAREREFRYLRKYTSDAAREYLDSQIVWIAGIECGDPRVLYETALRLRDGDGLPQPGPGSNAPATTESQRATTPWRVWSSRNQMLPSIASWANTS